MESALLIIICELYFPSWTSVLSFPSLPNAKLLNVESLSMWNLICHFMIICWLFVNYCVTFILHVESQRRVTCKMYTSKCTSMWVQNLLMLRRRFSVYSVGLLWSKSTLPMLGDSGCFLTYMYTFWIILYLKILSSCTWMQITWLVHAVFFYILAYRQSIHFVTHLHDYSVCL